MNSIPTLEMLSSSLEVSWTVAHESTSKEDWRNCWKGLIYQIDGMQIALVCWSSSEDRDTTEWKEMYENLNFLWKIALKNLVA